MSYRFSNMSWISRSKLTLNNFTIKPAASINPTTTNDDDPFVTLHHQSCMEIPPVAGNGIDIKSKDIRYIFIRPQCCVFSPFILSTAPRDAGSPGAKIAPTTTRYKLSPVVDDREGVAISPLGGE